MFGSTTDLRFKEMKSKSDERSSWGGVSSTRGHQGVGDGGGNALSEFDVRTRKDLMLSRDSRVKSGFECQVDLDAVDG